MRRGTSIPALASLGRDDSLIIAHAFAGMTNQWWVA
jgi:hypothetical protein